MLPLAMTYYTLNAENAICGPFTAPQLIEMLKTNALNPGVPAAAEGDSVWRDLSELLPALEEEVQREVLAILKTGPPTSPLMEKLLREDGEFPRPVKRQRQWRRIVR